jgi:hypothetical protein
MADDGENADGVKLSTKAIMATKMHEESRAKEARKAPIGAWQIFILGKGNFCAFSWLN